MSRLEQELRLAIKDRDYVKIAKLQNKINEAKQEEEDKKRVSLMELFSAMSLEDHDKLILLTNTMAILCDIQEKTAIDINSILNRLDGSRVEMYDPIVAAGRAAKAQANFVFENTSTQFQIEFGDIADEAEEVLKSFIKNKLKSNEQPCSSRGPKADNQTV